MLAPSSVRKSSYPGSNLAEIYGRMPDNNLEQALGFNFTRKQMGFFTLLYQATSLQLDYLEHFMWQSSNPKQNWKLSDLSVGLNW